MKEQIRREFSGDPGRYYEVRLFKERGFERIACEKCGRFFWSSSDRRLCPDDGPDAFSFIGDPPAPRKMDYVEAWDEIRSFFEDNGHTAVGRYPVVCRWRDDLYFTIASIVDFQRVAGSSVAFEFPANPLVVPQTCLRFSDLGNVGVTGRHFSSFCMVGQHSIEKGGYWKDECVELDYRLLTERLGIPGSEITFVEDVWAGGGSFGPSLEYHVRGLEMGNAVFTEFSGQLGSHKPLEQRIIDMGAGLERFAWMTSGTPTAYDCSFGPVTDMLLREAGGGQDPAALGRYYEAVAKMLDGPGTLDAKSEAAARAAGIERSAVARAEDAYVLADHARTLIFAIADGALPSNVGGGYNLRVILRRAIASMDRIGLRDMDWIIDAHVDYLAGTYPELDGARADVKKILRVESEKHDRFRGRMSKVAARLRGSGKTPTVDDLIRLYESDGITPHYLRKEGIIKEAPQEFYDRLEQLHQTSKRAAPAPARAGLEGVADTELLYYGDDPRAFRARVLAVTGCWTALDRTAFYPRGGGQEPDTGVLGGLRVAEVIKEGGVVLHRTEGGSPEPGAEVECEVDAERRDDITKNHTSTHIINASCREVLGSWIWQHSAFKEADHARLDVTHHSHPTDGEVRRIEERANQMISMAVPVTVRESSRGDAEKQHGFRIYQGGVVPVSRVRTVSVGRYDTEACGGTHVSNTSEIGAIRITRIKRVQDGVVRIEFVSGRGAREWDRGVKARRERGLAEQDIRAEVESRRSMERETSRREIPQMFEAIMSCESGPCGDGAEVIGPGRLCVVAGHAEKTHEALGKKITAADPRAAYCGITEGAGGVRVLCYAGTESKMRADGMAKKISAALGGSGGGDRAHARGGGRDGTLSAAVEAAKTLVEEA